MRKEATLNEWAKLYETVTKIKATEPWKYFWDMDIIYLSDEDAYISILGRGDEAYGISVYEGKSGFNDFKILASQDDLNISLMLAIYLQNNLNCYWGNREELSKKQHDIVKELGYKYRGRNQWLYFVSMKTGYVLYNFDRDEVIRATEYFTALLEALEKYISEPEKIDIKPGYMFCYSTKRKKAICKKIDSYDIELPFIPLTRDEELMEQLNALPKSRRTVEVDIIPLGAVIDDKKYDRPLNPAMFIIADKKTGIVLANELSKPDKNIFCNLQIVFVEALFDIGLPQKINVGNNLVGWTLSDLCDELNIKVEYKRNLPAVAQFERELTKAFS